MIYSLLNKLLSDWNPALDQAGLRLHPPLSVIQLAGIRGMNRKVNFLVFDRSSKNPVMVLKVARSLQHQAKLTKEFNCLKRVCAFPPMLKSVPWPLGIFDLHGHTVVAESFLPGIPLALLLRRQKRNRAAEVQKDFLLAQSWLESLQLVGKIQHQKWNGETLDKLLFKNVDMRTSDFRSDVAAELRKFDGLKIPVTATHGDFWPGNLLIDRDRVGVIDWESFSIKGKPLRDVFLFLTTYARSYPWQGWKWMQKEDAFRKAFLEKNWFSDQIREHVSRVFTRMTLPPSAVHLLFSEFLLFQAQQENAQTENSNIQWREYLSLYSRNSNQSIFRELE